MNTQELGSYVCASQSPALNITILFLLLQVKQWFSVFNIYLEIRINRLIQIKEPQQFLAALQKKGLC